MQDMKIRKLALGGIFAALVMLATYWLKLPVPVTQGYVHLGDGMIFLGALFLGPYAAFAAGIGSALADLLGGYMIYVLPTLLIKALMGLLAGLLARAEHHVRNALVFVLAEFVMVAGYYAFEGLYYNWVGAAGAVLPNIVQGVAGVAMGVAFSVLYPRLHRVPYSQQGNK